MPTFLHPTPACLQVDYVRVWQDPSAPALGCSPPAYPTEQYIACNRDTYVTTQADQALVPQASLAFALPAPSRAPASALKRFWVAAPEYSA